MFMLNELMKYAQGRKIYSLDNAVMGAVQGLACAVSSARPRRALRRSGEPNRMIIHKRRVWRLGSGWH